jgi:hypothetical protein
MFQRIEARFRSATRPTNEQSRSDRLAVCELRRRLLMSDPWTHHVAIVNGFRMHYVIAAKVFQLYFCTDGRRAGIGNR